MTQIIANCQKHEIYHETQWTFGIQAILDAMNQLLGNIYQLSRHIIKDNSLWPQELPGNHT